MPQDETFPADWPSNSILLNLVLPRDKQAETACWGTDLCNLCYPVHAALILLVIFGTSEGVGDQGGATEDWGVGSSTDVELGELVKVDFDGI